MSDNNGLEFEKDVDRCPTCGVTGAFAPCYDEAGRIVQDHTGRPIAGIVAEQDANR